MKSVLISTRPKWCEKICHEIGKDEMDKPIYEKRIEVRKSAPKEVPFKAYVYVTKDKPYLYGDMPIKEFYLDNGGYKGGECNGIKLCNGKVIGEFICDKVYSIKNQGNSFVVANEEQGATNEIARQSCLDYDDMVGYLGNKDGYGWHISDLKIYDKPKELREFYYCCKEMKANEPRAGKYVSLSCYACRHNALKRTEDYSEYNNMLGYICKRNITRPPQSYMFVEEVEEQNNNDN